MQRTLLVLENDDVAEEQNLSAITSRLVEGKINTLIFEPVSGFVKDIPEGAVGLIVGGGLPSVNDPKGWIEEEIALIKQAILAGLPILGICFGHQLIAKMFGSKVVRRDKRVGFANIRKVKDSPLFDGLPAMWRSAVYHSDRAQEVPDGFELIASSDYCAVQGLQHSHLPIYSVQFHPEIHFGINSYFADPVDEWDDESAFDSMPNKRLIDNFVDICTR